MDLVNVTAGFTKVPLSQVPLFDFVGNTQDRFQQSAQLIHNVLSKYQKPKILDLAMGSGPDTIPLLKEGYDVISNEVDEHGIELAQKAAIAEHVQINLRKINWLDIENSSEYQNSEFDFVFSLGNSFPNYLLSDEERKRALRGFWKILKPNGTLLFDTRNFDYIANHVDEILANPEENFPYSHKTNYIGKVVKGFPIEVHNDQARFIWKHYNNKTYADLVLWMATVDRVKLLIKETLGDVVLKIYYDYELDKPTQYDFVQYVLTKPGL